MGIRKRLRIFCEQRRREEVTVCGKKICICIRR